MVKTIYIDVKMLAMLGATLAVGLSVGFYIGRASVKATTRDSPEKPAYASGQEAPREFRRGFAKGMEKVFATPAPARLTEEELQWLEQISKLPAEEIGPSKLMALFHPQGYYRKVQNMTEAQSEKIFNERYNGRWMAPWTIYVTDVSAHSIEGVWAIHGDLKIRVSARFPFGPGEGKPDLTMINKGEVWRVQGQLDHSFWSIGSFHLRDCHIVSRVDVPSTWTLGIPLEVEPRMEVSSTNR